MLDRGNGQPRRDHHDRTDAAAARKNTARQRSAFAHAIEPLEARFLMTRYAIIGDLATTSATTLPLVATMVKGWNPEHIITTGDNNNDDDTNFDATIGQYFHEYMDPYPGVHGAGSTTGNRLWASMGNHDWDHPDGALPFVQYFNNPATPGGERYYSIRLGNVEFFMTDSDEREPDGTTPTSVQGQWLQGALTASSATWKIVVSHHPPYSSTTSPDAEWMRWPYQQWGADVVVSGHHHVYERLSVGGFPYIINSAAGAALGEWSTIDPNSQVRYDQRGGALQLDAEANTLTFRFFNRDSLLIDTFTLTDNTVPVPTAPSHLIAGAFSSSRIDVSWTDNATSETGFILERSPNGTSNWAQIATPAANVTSYVDTDPTLKAGLTYHYRVRADAGTPSANSNVGSATTLPAGYVNWIARGHTWKYLDTGVNQGTAWRPAAFNDSTWLAGRGQFGYGDGDETTIVSFGANAAAKYPTTYFRKSFNVDSPSQVLQLDLSMLRDDGAVVYLNGTEIWRSNMPQTGTITFGTFASSPQGGAEETAWHGLSINPALLVAGNNVIAAEIHQDNAGSSDLSFDMILTARLAAAIAPPSAFKATAVAHNQVNLSWVDTTVGELGFKIERATGTSNVFTQIGTAPAGATTYVDNTAAGGTSYTYRARSYNASGDSRSSSVSTVTTPAAPNALPAGWSSADVGAVAAQGSATHNAGVYTVNGSGADIAGTLDEFHFASTTWTGNGTIVARVNAITNPNAGAKFGIMFRESTAANSRHVMIGVTPANTIVVLARGASGNTSGPPVVTGVTTPVWLKLVRNGDIFTTQFSTNGTTWSAPSSSSPISMAATIRVGLCVTSKNDGTLATGTFDSVSISGSVTLSAAQDTAVATPVNSSNDKWKKVRTSMTEQVGLKEEPVDLFA